MSNRVMLAAESLRPGPSGIARVARLMARALHERTEPGVFEVDAIALNDAGPPQGLSLPTRPMAGSRLRFVAELHHAAPSHDHYLYDFAGVARAHPRVPLLRRPYLVWIHGIEVWERIRRDRRRALERATVVLANTDYTRRRAARYTPSLARARVCPLATESDEPGAVPSPDTRPTLTILARLDIGGGYKGHRELIQVWPKVLSAVPGAKLVIAGAGPGREVIGGWATRSPARDHIELTGFIPEERMGTLWARTTALAMPSRGEGFGLAYIEAMRHGIPVIASVHDAAVEVNVDGVTGYNVDLDARDAQAALLERIVHLLRDRDHARSLGAAGQSRWAERYTYSTFRDRFWQHLDALLRA